MSMLNWCPIPTSADVDIYLFLGCVTKSKVKSMSYTDVNQIFIFNQNATYVRRQPDVI